MTPLKDILVRFREVLGVDATYIHSKLEISQSRYSNWETGKKQEAKIDFYNAFRDVFGIDLYASREKDKFIITDPTKLSYYQFTLLIEAGAISELLPVYDIDASGGMLSFYRDETFITAAFPVPEALYKGSTFGIRVIGDSMSPDICDRDFIICKEVHAFEDIISGHIYLLSLTNGTDTVKTVHKHPKERDRLMLVPVNPGFPVKLIRKDEIIKIFKITGFIRRDEVLNKLAIPQNYRHSSSKRR